MPKIGDALKRAVETKPKGPESPGGRVRPSSALMNPNRRRIFKYLCLHPCSDIGQLSTGLGLSRSSVKWHLEILADSGYVQMCTTGKKAGHCPTGMISLHNMPIFQILARDDIIAVYTAILKGPGTTPGLLVSASGISSARARNSLASLQESGLVTTVKDGRHSRYFPTGRLDIILDEEKKTRREFERNLIGRLSAEHLDPEVVELKGANTKITIHVLGQKDHIEIPDESFPVLSQSSHFNKKL